MTQKNDTLPNQDHLSLPFNPALQKISQFQCLIDKFPVVQNRKSRDFKALKLWNVSSDRCFPPRLSKEMKSNLLPYLAIGGKGKSEGALIVCCQSCKINAAD